MQFILRVFPGRQTRPGTTANCVSFAEYMCCADGTSEACAGAAHGTFAFRLAAATRTAVVKLRRNHRKFLCRRERIILFLFLFLSPSRRADRNWTNISLEVLVSVLETPSPRNGHSTCAPPRRRGHASPLYGFMVSLATEIRKTSRSTRGA